MYDACTCASGHCARELEAEARAFAWPGLDPDTSLMLLHDLLADGQTETTSIELTLCMQPRKCSEDLRLIGGVDTDAVVLDAEAPACSLWTCTDTHHWRRARTSILDRVGNQVEQQLIHTVRVGAQAGQGIHVHA